jgi:hypothetical protein
MKTKIILTIAIAWLLIISFNSNAQTAKGTLFLGATLGTTSYSASSDNLDYTSGTNINRSTSTKTSSLSFGPQVGVFVTDHLVIGGTINYSITSRVADATLTSSTTIPTTTHTNATNYTVNIGPFLRYYFYNLIPVKNLVYIQVNGTAGTGNGSSSGSGVNVQTTYTTDGKVSNLSNWNTGASLGITHFFNPSVGMDFALGYAYTSSTSGNTNSTNTTNKASSLVTITNNNYNETTTTNGITLSLGFHWYLVKKHHKTIG